MKKDLNQVIRDRIVQAIDTFAINDLTTQVADLLKAEFIYPTHVKSKLFEVTWVLWEVFNELDDEDLDNSSYYASELVSEIEDLIIDCRQIRDSLKGVK